MEHQLINRDSLKSAMKGRASYRETAGLLGISTTALAFKVSGRKGRGLVPFTEEEIQILRSMFGDSILYPVPRFRKPKEERN